MAKRKRPRDETELRVVWSSFDIVLMGQDGSRRTPFRDELGGQDDELRAIQKMRLVQSHGWPEARLRLKDSRGKNLIDRADHKDPPIYILKCKPSCWRLYFHVYPSGRIVYLHAVCKQQWARDPGDSVVARARLEQCAHVIAFPFPD